jgi:hypothetical protein
MENELTVVLTQTYDLKPLAVVRSLSGLDAELTPCQLRAVAEVLRAVAEECESRPMGKKAFVQVTKNYVLTGQVNERH